MSTRIRIRYSKRGKVRFTSHRDVARMWERALRKAQVPLVYTAGFSPRPRMSFGLALPTGSESLAEYLDLDIDGDGAWPWAIGSDEQEALGRLSRALPAGVDAMSAAVLDSSFPSLQEGVSSCRWEMHVGGTTPAELEAIAESALRSGPVIVTRQRKGQDEKVDIGGSLLRLAVLGPAPCGALLEAELATKPRGVKPAELLEGLGSGLELVWSCRTHQWIERDGTRLEPLRAGAADASHALERAS